MSKKTEQFTVTLKRPHTHRGVAHETGAPIEAGRAAVQFLAERGVVDKPSGFDTPAFKATSNGDKAAL